MNAQLLVKKILMLSLMIFVGLNLSLFPADPYPGEGAREILVKAGSVIDDIESDVEAIVSVSDSIESTLEEIACLPKFISSAPYTITEPGTYIVTQDLTVASGVCITIASDDVVLNLCGKTLLTNGSSVTACINIDSHKNITIKNGAVAAPWMYGIRCDSCESVIIENINFLSSGPGLGGITLEDCTSSIIRDCIITNGGTGIRMSSVENIKINNVTIINCQRHGIWLAGTPSSISSDIEISNCVISRSEHNLEPAFFGAINLEYGRKIKVVDCQVNNNGDLRDNIGKDPLAGVYLDHCSDCLIKNVQAHDNQRKGVVIGFLLEESNNNILENCSAIGNRSEPTIILSHRAPSFSEDAVAYGFYLCSNSKNNVLRNCTALANKAVGGDVTYNHRSAGFGLNNSDENILIDCIANKQQADPSPGTLTYAYGFDIQYSGWCNFIRCLASDNETDGFLFYKDKESEVKDCQAMINNDYGFDLSLTSTDILFIRNIACYNILGNYNNVTSAPVSSPADARGVDNVNCSLIDEDSVDIIESKLFEMDSEIDEIISRLETFTICY